MDYTGKVVVITGAASGLGAAMAGVFARAGAHLALLDIDADALARAAQQWRDAGTEVLDFPLDVADSDNIAEAIAAIAARFDGIDVLAANVGVQHISALDKLTRADWDWVFNVNVHGMIETVQQCLPLIRSRRGSRHIVLTASSSVLTPCERIGAYVASKYAVTGYGEVLRQELADEGINVALMFPSGMITRHIESSMAARPATLAPAHIDPEDVEAMKSSLERFSGLDVQSADYAVRHLLTDLEAGHPYIITHGDLNDALERYDIAMRDANERAQRPDARPIASIIDDGTLQTDTTE